MIKNCLTFWHAYDMVIFGPKAMRNIEGNLGSGKIHKFLSFFAEVFAGRRGIAPTRNCTHLLINLLNLFWRIKLNFFLQFSFLYLIYSLSGYNRIKISGCNSAWVQYQVNRFCYKFSFLLSGIIVCLITDKKLWKEKRINTTGKSIFFFFISFLFNFN